MKRGGIRLVAGALAICGMQSAGPPRALPGGSEKRHPKTAR